MSVEPAALPKFPFPQIWDSTIRAAFVACPYKWAWEYGLKRVPTTATSVHLHFGGCFARGLEVFRTTFWDNPTLDNMSAAKAAGLRAMALFWGDYEEPEGSPKSFSNCVLAYESYLREYPPLTDHLKPFTTSEGKANAAEFSFAIPLEDVFHPETNEPVIYAGKFDMIAEYNNCLYVLDEKTTSRLGSTWASQWDMRGQFIGYAYAAQRFELPVVGAAVRGTAIKKSGIDHAEVIFQIPEWKIQEWRSQLANDINLAIRMWHSHQRGDFLPFSKNFSESCQSYGGCSHKVLCNTLDPVRWAETYTMERTWNPLETGN